MLRPHEEARAEFEIICLEDFIPEDHLLRKIAAHIDFSFIHNIVKDLYRETQGRMQYPHRYLLQLSTKCKASYPQSGEEFF